MNFYISEFVCGMLTIIGFEIILVIVAGVIKSKK